MGCSQSNTSPRAQAPTEAVPNIRNHDQQVRQMNARRVRAQQPSQARSQQQTAVSRIQYLQNSNVEKIIEGKSAGEGIKRTPAYETPLSKHDLLKWRNEFWETRTSGLSQVWNMLKSCCEEDHETANALILAAGMQMPQNSLTLVVDEGGMYYRVPICMINDPENFNADFVTQKLFSKEKPNESFHRKLKIRSAKGDVSLQNVSNLTVITQLKEKYIQNLAPKQKEGLTPDRLRFFCLGKELKNDLFVYSYDIANDMTIQCMLKPQADNAPVLKI